MNGLQLYKRIVMNKNKSAFERRIKSHIHKQNTCNYSNVPSPSVSSPFLFNPVIKTTSHIAHQRRAETRTRWDYSQEKKTVQYDIIAFDLDFHARNLSSSGLKYKCNLMSSLEYMKKDCFASGTLSSASLKGTLTKINSRRHKARKKISPQKKQEPEAECDLCR